MIKQIQLGGFFRRGYNNLTTSTISSYSLFLSSSQLEQFVQVEFCYRDHKYKHTNDRTSKRWKLEHDCCRNFSSRSNMAGTIASSLRRPRNYVGYAKVEGNTPSWKRRSDTIDGLEEPYEHHDNDNLENYLQKASLSPWTPVPDVVARKMFDMILSLYDNATNHQNYENDHVLKDMIHIDLGCGDGRVNFHAIDYYGIKQSIGIDIDQNIIKVAINRLHKRFPQPNIEFLVGDLLNPPSSSSPSESSLVSNRNQHNASDNSNENNGDIIWDKIRQADIITMYFATDGLKLIRPLLERYVISSIGTKLSNRKSLIITTCGYEMPGWKSYISEVILGTQIHLYQFGDSLQTDMIHDDNSVMIHSNADDNSILYNPPKDFLLSSEEKLNGANVIDRTGKYSIRGFNPKLLSQEYDGDDDDDDDDYEDENDVESYDDSNHKLEDKKVEDKANN